MPGLYTVDTRTPGTLITGLVYNFDHQVHVDGRTATEVQSYATSSSQMDIQEDPAPGGVESLPPSLAGELSRLRFVLSDIKSSLRGVTGKWYTPIAGVNLITAGAHMRQPLSIVVPNATMTALDFVGGSASFNTGVWSSGATTRFTAPTNGLYLAFASILWAASAALGSSMRELFVTLNGVGTIVDRKSCLVESVTAQRMTICTAVKMTATEWIEFFVQQHTGASTSVLGSGTGAAGLSIVGGLVRLGKT